MNAAGEEHWISPKDLSKHGSDLTAKEDCINLPRVPEGEQKHQVNAAGEEHWISPKDLSKHSSDLTAKEDCINSPRVPEEEQKHQVNAAGKEHWYAMWYCMKGHYQLSVVEEHSFAMEFSTHLL